jgi:hypothetical protein
MPAAPINARLSESNGLTKGFFCTPGIRRKQMASDARRQRESLDQFSANTNR